MKQRRVDFNAKAWLAELQRSLSLTSFHCLQWLSSARQGALKPFVTRSDHRARCLVLLAEQDWVGRAANHHEDGAQAAAPADDAHDGEVDDGGDVLRRGQRVVLPLQPDVDRHYRRTRKHRQR